MMAARPATAPRPAMSATTLHVFEALLEARTGQQVVRSRTCMIDSALQPVLRQRGLTTFDQLVALLLEGSDARIADQIVDALLNQETSFFRDAAMFDLVVEAAADIEAKGRKARIWSVGCSTGQEPLSLAMLFAERAAEGKPMPDILATDVSDAAIARAKAGRYTQFEIQRGLPIRRMMRWFEGEGSDWVARPELTRMVAFRRHNLCADRMPGGPFDVILCRNVLLYLSPETKADVFARFAKAIRPGGALVLGAGETVIGQTPLFEPCQRRRGLYAPVVAKAARAA